MEEGWTHDETFWGERCKKYPLLVPANPAKWRVHVQGDDIKWFREIETCKVKGKDGYLYEPLWLAPEDAEARGIEDGDIVKMFNERGTILCGARISERVTDVYKRQAHALQERTHREGRVDLEGTLEATDVDAEFEGGRGDGRLVELLVAHDVFRALAHGRREVAVMDEEAVGLVVGLAIAA